MPPPLPTNLNQPQNVQQLSTSGTQQTQANQFHQQHVAALAQHHHQNAGAGSNIGILGVPGTAGIQQITANSSSIQSGSNIIGGINVLPSGVQQQHINVVQKLHSQHIQQQQLHQQQQQQQQQQQSLNTASTAGLVMSSGGGISSDTLLTTEINKFRSYVVMLADHTSKDDSKLKAAQELNESFEIILQAPDYPKFLEHCIKNFLKILTDGDPLFISEYNIQQMRKLLLEMIHRFPTNQDLKPHLNNILTTVLHLLNVENEENTLVCLRIIIELHKMFRPPYNKETQKFLQYVKSIYAELPNHLNRIFEPRSTLKVKDLSAINIEQQLKDTFTLTIIQSEMKSQDGTAICYNLIPKGTMSLKVLQELPIIVVLFFQIYKENVKQDIREYITLIMNTITLQPSLEQRKSPSFNKEVFVDFMGAQIKTLSFIAYIIRSHHEDVAAHSQQMVHGILGLLELCPQEVCHLRKELLIAIRHIVATDLKKKFVPHMERLFDENILLGNGWTVRDTLRPLAYSTLADLVHHVRQDLPLTDLARAVHLFGKIVHDPTLNTTIQTMSCKLLLNLVDCIKNQSKGEKNAVQCRELLMRMLEIFVLKFKTFAKLQLPILINKSKPLMQQNLQTQTSTNNMTGYQQRQPDIKQEPGANNVEMKQEPGQGTARLASTLTASATGGSSSGVPPPIQQEAQEKSKFGFPQQQMSYNVADYRSLVKTLVCGVKTITWGCSSININELPNGEQGKDTLVFIRLVKWAMKALDIYQVQLPNVGVLAQFQGRQIHNRMMLAPNQSVRTQEEKEVLEHFSGVFSLMSTSVFRDVFSTCISYMVERIHQNVALQTIANTFLANPPTSSVFATVLVEYLLERMNEMGSPIDRSNLYLRLFKVLFGSVTLFKENELMLKPHLHQIVNRSMELSTNAKEPYNYFLLLRALFRSIGGGSHDLLYEVFLPLLPNLLEGLNRLQSGLHKPHMKDLFVELCLTVPVRLSSLLPYLPMLMDPLVSALNGSHTLVSQGLRTLELCVDNLKPEFLYLHIQPVRADLMQALWRTLRNPDQVAHVAFRVLGKFGGGNRKMMIEPQRLEYNDRDSPGPTILVEFQDHERSIEFPVEKIIETAVNALKSSTTDSFYHKQCWEVIRCYLAASLNLTDRKHTMLGLFLYPSFVNDPIDQSSNPLYKCADRVARKTHLTALTGMFVAAAIKELRQDVQPRMVSLVTHYTMVAIAQQAGPAPIKGKVTPPTFLDPLVLIDALAVIMAHEEKELCKPGYLALGLILDTATNILGSKEKACQLPLMDYLKDRMCALCYERAWYSKLGGCIAIKFLFERMSTRWVYQHLYTFLKALMFVMMDLIGEVSSGALDMAKSNLRKMLTICIAPVDPNIVTLELLTAREKALYDVTSELLGLVTSSHTLVREQAMYCIRVLAGCCGTKGVDPQFSASILAPHIEVLTDIINSNVLELNKETIDKVINICIVPCDLNKSSNNLNINNTSASINTNLSNEEIQTARDKAFYDVTNELARLATQKGFDYKYKEYVVYCLRVLITCKTILNTTNASTISSTVTIQSQQTSNNTLDTTTSGLMPMVMQPHLDVLKDILTSDGFSSVAEVMVSHIDILKTTIPNWSSDETKLNIECLLILLCTTMNEYKTIITQSTTPTIILTAQQLNNIIQVRDKVIQDVSNELVQLIATLTTQHTSSASSLTSLTAAAAGATTTAGDTTVTSTLLSTTQQQQTSTIESSYAGGASATSMKKKNTNYLLLKEQAMYCLRTFAECNGFSGGDDGSIASIMSPHIEVLKDIVPPTKHQLILQPANAQIGLMDGNTFCMMLTPRLFTFDLKTPTHKSFFDELLLLLCKSDDALTKLQCYQNISNLVLVRKAALRCISTYHRLPKEVSVKIFTVLYDALGWENNELQETAYECMHKFINGYQIDIDLVRSTMRTLLISLGDSRNLTLNFVKRLSYLTKLFPAIFNEKLCEQLLQHLKQFLDNLKDAKKLTKNGENEQKIAIIILIFHRITSASPKFISVLCELVLETEKQLLVEASSAFREPLMKFLLKHSGDTLELFLQDYRLKDQQWSRYLIYLIKHNDGKPFRDYLQNYCVPRLIQLLLIMQNNTNQQLTLQDKYELRHQSIRIISLLIKYDSQWLSKQSQIIDGLKQIWCDDAYQELHTKVDTVDITHWKQPKLIVKILLQYFQHDPQQIELLFELLRAFCHRFIPDFQFLRDFLETCVAQNYTIEWKRQAFFKFVEVFKNDQVSQVLKCHIVQLILIPCFSNSGIENMNALIAGVGSGNNVDTQQPNVVTIFIYNIIEKQSFNLEDCLRIALLQFSCLLVEQASPHIHDSSSNKQQGNKLRKLMTFAWPCLLVKNCVDATTRYHGHLLLAHIIEKFAIHKKIVLQVFHSLVKAHAQEARAVVKQALEILTPAMPFRMEDGNTMLIHWTKKIIVEEGHSVQQLYHILQLVVRHYKVYYPVRHHLIQYIVNSINRLGFSQTSTLEHKKLAVELAEVIVKWELQRLKDDEVDDMVLQDKKRIALTGTNQQPIPSTTQQANTTGSQNILGTPGQPPQSTTPSPKIDADARKPIKSKDADAVINFLLRLACQVNESTNSAIPIQQAGGAGTPGEMLSKRCVTLLKTALKPELWPQKCDLKLDEWFNKVFLTVDGRDPNYANISTALELLNFLLSVMKHEQILNNFVHLQTGLSACLYTKETKIISLVHNLLSKLVSMFPVELSGANFGCQYEQLRVLYCNVGTMISDGLRNYEEDPKPVPSSLFGPLMILKACCTKNPACIDKIITSFMKVLQKMTKEHLSSTTSNDNSGPDKLASELLILSLDLVKTRVVVMSVEQRKTFIGTILVGLIEKTQDIKVMRAITRMLEEWIKCRNPITLQQAPSLREKSILLVKLMQYVEKRFPDDIELNTQFLELVNYVYSDEHLKTTELSMKLQPAFMSGLRCTVQPAIRAKFFHVLDASMRRRLIDRLLYIVCSQCWDAIGPHYWLKQCIELLLVTAVSSKPIQMAPNSCLLPSVEAVLRNTDSKVKDKVFEFIQKDPVICAQQQQNLSTTDALGNGSGTPQKSKPDRIQTIEQHVNQQADYLSKAREVETGQFLQAAAQLCHMDTQLAERVWLDLFPRLWSILYSHQHTMLIPEIVSFVSSGTHVIQKDCHPSAMTTFLEALSQCTPTIPIKPAAMKYLGKSHNLWHRMTLNLEQMAFDQNAMTQVQKQKRDTNMDCYDFETDQVSPQAEIMDSLSDMYALLSEDDMWSGLWQRHAKFRETVIAISFEQHGFFEQAQGAYEVAMSRYKQDTNVSQKEVLLWEQRWIRCAKELNQWDLLLEYGVSKHERNPFLILESSWRVPNWTAMKEALAQVEYSCPKEMAWKVNLYRGFLGICNTEERHLQVVDRCVELASGLCMREWRRLPKIVSHAHLPLLQAAQQIIELQEAAAQIYQRLVQPSPGLREPYDDMKTIVKTWKNRLPVISDDLSHWSDIFTWRQHHYQFIAKYYDNGAATQGEGTIQTRNPAMLGIRASAQAIIHFAKIARKHNLTGVCLESLSRIYTIPLVPVSDIFEKFCQHVKCYLQMAAIDNSKASLEEGYKVLENTNLSTFTDVMKSEYYTMKGLFLAQLGKSDEANKTLSAATQIKDTHIKAWALWGDYLEALFIRDRTNIQIGVFAITCFLHTFRNHQDEVPTESKSRKHLAKILWLLTYDDDKSSLMKALEKYSNGVPALHWLPWTPQLVSCLVQYPGEVIFNLLTQVARVFPQAVYLPMRTMYLTIKIEQRVGHKTKMGVATTSTISGGGNENNTRNSAAQNSAGTDLNSSQSEQQKTQQEHLQQQQSTTTGGGQPVQGGSIRANPLLLRCTSLLRIIRDIHPIVLQSLEGFVEEMSWFRETWYEEVLRQLRQCLAKCYAVAFENRSNVNEAKITPHISNFVHKLVTTFGTGIENIANSAHEISSLASESLARRIKATTEDPVFQKIKTQFTQDFDSSHLTTMKLHNLINKLKKWVKILESKTKVLPRSLLIEEKCRFLSNFSLKTAEVELPGEFLLPKHPHYFVRIARFMPKVDIVQKHNTAARRLYIRGHNGKIYPYLVVIDGIGDGRREERVLQLLRMLNHYLCKQKETSKRFLHYTVPRVVAVSPQIRLVEDNPASISLLDIFKNGCAKLNIDHCAPITMYYERLANAQQRGQQASHPMLRDILKSVQSNMVPKTMLKNWALQTFPSATDYWTFRKMFTLQLALACFSEYVLHLTRLNPDMMYLHQDSGLINISYFKFDVDDHTGELDTNRPVPFRLTPNIIEFLTCIGVSGPLTASMIAAARCLVQPNFKVQSILRAILKDEMIAGYKKKLNIAAAAAAAAAAANSSSGNILDNSSTLNNQQQQESDTDHLINMVNKAVNVIVSRLNGLANFDVNDSKVSTLVVCASSADNLCRMDPAWHPWL